MVEVEPLTRYEKFQRRTRNSNSENENIDEMTPRKKSTSPIILTANSCSGISGNGCKQKHKVKSGKSMARLRLGLKRNVAFALRSFSGRKVFKCPPFIVNALIFILFTTNVISFVNCAVLSAANSESLNLPQHIKYEDTTTTTSSTKYNPLNNNNTNKNFNKLNDTQNLSLPEMASAQKR